jgi:pimeloyl-ACP methyl ester carboxylesterase
VLERLAASGVRTVAYDARAHGRSDAPHGRGNYGDARLALDLAEVVGEFATPDAILAGYSMGSATILVALAAGLAVRGAVLGAVPAASLVWSDTDQSQLDAAVAVLEGAQDPGPMQWWVDYLDAVGADTIALAAFLRGHRPVIETWETIRVPVILCTGSGDTMAAAMTPLLACLVNATAVELAGDHITSVTDPRFTEAAARLARRHEQPRKEYL